MANTGKTVKKKSLPPWLMIVGFLFVFFAALVSRSVYRAKECARMADCISNVMRINSACSQYAQNFGGVFPPKLSLVYPDYVSSLDIFICPSRKPAVTESDVLNNFTICYEYVSGLTKQDNQECLLIYDREKNHRIGDHEGDRNVAFVGGRVQMIKKENWSSVWQNHEKGLLKRDLLDNRRK